MKTLNKVTEVNSRGRKFFIVKDENGYWGIEDKYFTDGKLNKQINGIEGHLSETRSACIQAVLDTIEVQYLVSTGMELMDALDKVYLT